MSSPSLNPWLRPIEIKGFDEHGQERTAVLPKLVPALYFWLGREAYPDWLIVWGVKPSRSETYTHNHRHIGCGMCLSHGWYTRRDGGSGCPVCQP